MNPDYHAQVSPLPRQKSNLKDRQHKLVAINFSNMNIPDCKFVSNGMQMDPYNEYIQFLESKKQDGHLRVSPPIHLMPSPQQNLSNVNNNNNSSVNLNKTNWKNRLESGHSPHESESEERCHSYIYKKPENRFRNHPRNNNTPQLYENNHSYNKYNNCNNNNAPVCNSSQMHVNSQYQSNFNYKPRYYTNTTASARQRRDAARKHHPQEIFRRVYGLMERFTSKSHLLRVSPKFPIPISMDNDFSDLTQSMWDVFYTKAQKESTYLHKLELWKMVYLQIRKILVRYGLYMVGSTMSGLGAESSDIDMCLLVKPCLNDARSDALGYLQNIQNVLLNCDFVTSPEVILAKVPILKFKDARYGFEVDLNCNNAVGIRNTHLLHCYAYLDWRVRPLVIVVKLWAQANNINDAKRMTISSYSLVLMVIHFLQFGVTPRVLPCLHGLYPHKFNPTSEIHDIDIQEELPPFHSDNKLSLGELFLDFLHYYTCFNFDLYAVSVRAGTVLLKEECRHQKSMKNDATQWKLLCIEEPFDLTNTARSVYDIDTFEHIKNVFKVSHKILCETMNLNSILPNVEVYSR